MPRIAPACGGDSHLPFSFCSLRWLLRAKSCSALERDTIPNLCCTGILTTGILWASSPFVAMVIFQLARRPFPIPWYRNWWVSSASQQCSRYGGSYIGILQRNEVVCMLDLWFDSIFICHAIIMMCIHTQCACAGLASTSECQPWKSPGAMPPSPPVPLPMHIQTVCHQQKPLSIKVPVS